MQAGQFKSVINELKAIKSKVICFTDDECLIDYERMMEMAEEIKSNGIKKRYIMMARADTIAQHRDLLLKWKEIGLDDLGVGFEYIFPERLKNTNKKIDVEMQNQAVRYLREIGVLFTPLFIVDPNFDRDEFDSLKKYIQKQNYFRPEFSILTPLPGTSLYLEQKDKINIRDWDLFDGLHAVVKTRLPEVEFYKLFWDLTPPIPIFKKIKILLRYPVGDLPAIMKALIIYRIRDFLKKYN